ncbi:MULTISPECIES: glycerate kinase family protein [Tsukamurella]|uniref:Glycerate kinase n=1 Tax=Tsukamurella strandjordii TaxID=147577 RepID=A0AA90NNM3_9ACTN|nr:MULTISPECIES: glycerate kinase [Tsukamurella]MDP0397804.1 glycerate kinase [Tsukamurella strandjordii]GIZ99248.1 glycerate kinase [Tsukamurella sp. TY48]
MRVVIAPDSFKGSIDAEQAASALRDGWLGVRPDDEVIALPQADGGEGTVATIAAAPQWLNRSSEVTGPDGRPVRARWTRARGGDTVIELAESSGIALVQQLMPMTATTDGLGEVIAAALDEGATRIRIGLGGSASTDGGFGALRALGLRAFDRCGCALGTGATVRDVAAVDLTHLRSLPPGGVELLVDTDIPLYGPDGAAQVYGPQKGADSTQVRELDDGLRSWAAALAAAGCDPALVGAQGAGAAGGVGFGLLCWGATATSGADRIAELTGLAQNLPTADIVVTGEGRFDATSLTGKVVGRIVDRCRAAATPVVVVAGQVAIAPQTGITPVHTLSLTDLAGTAEESLADPARWLRAAGDRAAKRFAPTR